MANAFDRVSLPYLTAVLKKFGFSNDIIDVISVCIMGPWIASLINGRPSDFFQSFLSPFLYMIMAYSLSRDLEKSRRERTLTGLHISYGVRSINHSLFVDDTLLMGGASCIITQRFKKVIDNFMEVSGGLLNNAK